MTHLIQNERGILLRKGGFQYLFIVKVFKRLLEVAFITYNNFEHVALDGKPFHGVHDISKTKNGRAKYAQHMSKETYSMIESLLIDGVLVDTICNVQFMNEYFKNIPTI